MGSADDSRTPSRGAKHDVDDDPLLRELAQAPEVRPDEQRPAAPPRPELPEVIGHYRIVESLARGGMGEVFKAQDTTLDRMVALKFLPGGMEESPTQVKRFLQEARAASALNHPNIITVYEIYECELPRQQRVTHCIAMELIDGPTLRDWVEETAPDLPRVVEVFEQVAQGLSKAHAAGIVHRDLKPENIMISRDGYAKILDFGLAKLVAPTVSLEDDPTGAPGQGRLTRTGVVMGTVGYMSPEQVLGADVDQRSDIFAFGSMLYESVAGARPFAGETNIDTLHQIVHSEQASLVDTRFQPPPELDRIVRKCLAKDPDERYQTTKDLAIDLRQLRRRLESGGVTAPELTGVGPAPGRRGLGKLGRWAAAVLVVLGAVAAALVIRYVKARQVPPTAQALLAGLRIERLTYSGKANRAQVAPDGKVVAHVVKAGGRSSLWVRQVATASSVQIVPPGESSFIGVTITPDGNYVYYVRERGHALVRDLYRVPILGGASRKVLTDVDSPVTFSPDGKRFAFVRCFPAKRDCGLLVASADGRRPRVIGRRPVSSRPFLPVWSPDGKRIAFFARAGGTKFELLTIPVEGGQPTSLSRRRWVAVGGLAWMPDGTGLVSAATGGGHRVSQLWYIAYPSGKARRLTNDPNNYVDVSVTSDGATLVATQVERVSNIWLSDSTGKGAARQLTTGAGHYHSIAAAADGRIVYASLQGGSWDLWLMPPGGGPSRRLTQDAGSNYDPVISPDGKKVAFVSDRQGPIAIWLMDLDGANPRRLSPGNQDAHPSFTPDGQWVVYSSYAGDRQTTWKVSVNGGAPVQVTPRYTKDAEVSPDGKRLIAAYWNERYESPWVVAVLPMGPGKPEKTFALPPTATLLVQWAPGADAFSYLDHQGGTSNVWIQPLAGAPRQVTDFNSDRIFHYRWVPGGTKIALVRGLLTSDVVVMRSISRRSAGAGARGEKP